MRLRLCFSFLRHCRRCRQPLRRDGPRTSCKSPAGAVKDVTAGREAHVIGLDVAPILAETLLEVIAARDAAPAITEAPVAHATIWGQAPIRVDTGPHVEHSRTSEATSSARLRTCVYAEQMRLA